MSTEPSTDHINCGLTTEKIEQGAFQVAEIEKVQDLVYDDVDEEPELHMRTYIALASMFMLNLVQLVALQGPPSMVGANHTRNKKNRAVLTTAFHSSTTLETGLTRRKLRHGFPMLLHSYKQYWDRLSLLHPTPFKFERVSW